MRNAIFLWSIMLPEISVTVNPPPRETTVPQAKDNPDTTAQLPPVTNTFRSLSQPYQDFTAGPLVVRKYRPQNGPLNQVPSDDLAQDPIPAPVEDRYSIKYSPLTCDDMRRRLEQKQKEFEERKKRIEYKGLYPGDRILTYHSWFRHIFPEGAPFVLDLDRLPDKWFHIWFTKNVPYASFKKFMLHVDCNKTHFVTAARLEARRPHQEQSAT